jgi:hypothetical protein
MRVCLLAMAAKNIWADLGSIPWGAGLSVAAPQALESTILASEGCFVLNPVPVLFIKIRPRITELIIIQEPFFDLVIPAANADAA